MQLTARLMGTVVLLYFLYCSATTQQSCADAVAEDTTLVGTGHCVDLNGDTPLSYSCSRPSCPVITDLGACTVACVENRTCAGFELRNITSQNTTNGVGCFVFTAGRPSRLPWSKHNGTQRGGIGRAVVTTDGSPDVCCYKRSYPRPNPPGTCVPHMYA